MAAPESLKTARERARQAGLPYDGALLPNEAYEVWQELPGTYMVDVRTRAERDWVGRIPGAIEIEWSLYPGNVPNKNFVSELQQQVDKASRLLFICRSGHRSHSAATLARQAGYAECYNVLEGFEGDKDATGHRNTKGGWRVAGLPWAQS
jgi:rhodanese-related sulfurtransferase